jgi:hypothetical protein
VIWALLWACGGPPEPELGAVRATLDAFEAGRDALAAGDAATAREAFGRARELQDDPLLATWEAAAEVKAGARRPGGGDPVGGVGGAARLSGGEV